MPAKGFRKVGKKQNVAVPLSPMLIHQLDHLADEYPLARATIARACIEWSLTNKSFRRYLTKLAQTEGFYRVGPSS
ncbi:hypothetical protein JXQ70_01045 [bacterium]|nr:hypothetical protein [bacterium]